MILLLSGEGVSDLGASKSGGVCRGDRFAPGPLSHIIDKILSPIVAYSVFDNGFEELLCFVPETQVMKLEKVEPKSLRFGGLKRGKGTALHFTGAEKLGRYALQLEKAETEKVIAVFFRDSDKESDGTWEEKMASMAKGFDAAEFERGVAMIPKPKSEAWFLCAFKNNYVHCAALESGPQTDGSPNSLKIQLDRCCGALTAEQLTDKVAAEIEVERLDMPSYNAFKKRLESVAKSL